MALASAAFAVLPDIPALRRVRPELMHVTLAFLGAVPDERLDDVGAAVRDGVAGPAACPGSFHSLGRLPPNAAPTLVWPAARRSASGPTPPAAAGTPAPAPPRIPP